MVIKVTDHVSSYNRINMSYQSKISTNHFSQSALYKSLKMSIPERHAYVWFTVLAYAIKNAQDLGPVYMKQLSRDEMRGGIILMY